MKKIMSIVQDQRQIGVRIPKQMVEELKITKEDSIEWESNKKDLRGKLIKYGNRKAN